MLRNSVDGYELTAVNEVVIISLNGPGGLFGGGVLAIRETGKKLVVLGGGGVTSKIGVAVGGVGSYCSSGITGEGDGVVVDPFLCAIGDATDIGAVVGVAGDVDGRRWWAAHRSCLRGSRP